LLQVSDLWKSFGGSQALRGTTLTVGEGEIHGLLGANGSGKSTLIKVLAGYHDADAGSVELHGERVPLPLGAGQPQHLGLAFVHQDLGLVPSVSALENYLLASLATSRRSLRISWRTARRQMRATLERYGIDIDPRALVADLRPVDRALLAIVRALESPGVEVNAPRRLVVLDEPTVFLPQQEVSRLFDLMRRVAAEGSSVLFVSHDLDEVRGSPTRSRCSATAPPSCPARRASCRPTSSSRRSSAPGSRPRSPGPHGVRRTGRTPSPYAACARPRSTGCRSPRVTVRSSGSPA
jgi:ribose transport system ATP-binding protein